MFYDRYEAGRDLAEKLTEYTGSDAVICAIPRGGILTGLAVAKRLDLPMKIMIVGTVERVSLETAIHYAVTEFGTTASISDEPLPESEIEKALQQAKQKRRAYTDSEDIPTWKDKTVIVVDDGAESGLTIKAVVMSLQEQKPEKVIVALPAASASVVSWLHKHVDEVIVIKTDSEFKGMIHEHFSHYPEVFDKEVHVAYWHAKHVYEHNHNSTT